jgi:protein O-mannosyl-transferase
VQSSSASANALTSGFAWRDAALCLAAVAAGGVVYLNALHNPFLYDDYRTIVENASIRQVSDVRAIVLHEVTRPLVNMSFAIDEAVWGSTPFGFHLTSVVLHAANVALLFLLASRLAADGARDRRGNPTLTAFLAAAPFAVHPLMTEAVGYVSARSEVLCTTIFLLAFLAGRRWLRRGGAVWWWLTVVLWGAAVSARELAAMLPLVLFAYDHVMLDDDRVTWRRRFWRLHAPLIGLSVGASLVRLAMFAYVEHPGGVGLSWRSVLEQAIVAWRYVWLLLGRGPLAIYHPVQPVLGAWDPRGLAALASIALAVAAAWQAQRVDRLGRFGVIWFFLLLVPSSLLVVLRFGDGMAEHRAYAASCGLFLAAGSAGAWLMRRLSNVSRVGYALAHAVIVVSLLSLGARTVLRNLVWGDPIGVWREASTLAPDDPVPHTVLGEELDRRGRYEEAAVEYRTALMLHPTEPLAYLRLGVCLALLQRFDDARATFERLRTIAPESTTVSTGLAVVAMMAGQPDRARAHFKESLDRDPHDVMTLQWLALFEEEAAGDPAAALRRCEQLQELAPGRLSNEDCIRRNRARLAAARAGQP